MSRLTKIELTAEQQAALEKGAKHGPTHGFRQRCQMILLKAQHQTSKEIGAALGCCLVTVNSWVKRYREEGIAGLHVREGRGRPALLNESDLPAVREAVAANTFTQRVDRQRIALAQAALAEQLGRKFSRSTLKRFLKKTVADSSKSGAS